VHGVASPQPLIPWDEIKFIRAGLMKRERPQFGAPEALINGCQLII
jgi:hypothetical protein